MIISSQKIEQKYKKAYNVRKDAIMLEKNYILPNVRQGGVSDFIEDEVRRICNCPKIGEKSIGDVFLDNNPINVKTIDLGKDFHMPNLVSAKKAYDFLLNPDNKLFFMFVEYTRIEDTIYIQREIFKEIEELASIKIQAQGEGVIQLQTMLFRDHVGRSIWLDEFRSMMQDFIKRQRKKWNSRWDYYKLGADNAV